MRVYSISLKIIFFILVLFTKNISGQTGFYKTYTNYLSAIYPEVLQLPDSGYIIYSTQGFSNENQSLRRVDKFGNTIWQKEAPLGPIERSGSIILTNSNCLITSGKFGNNSNICKYDLDGNIIFSKQISGISDPQVDILESNNKDLYFLNSKGVVKTDSLGNLKWAKAISISTSGNEYNSVHQVSNNKILITGSSQNASSAFSNWDLIQLYIDTSGNILSTKVFDSSYLLSMEKTSHKSFCFDGNVYQFFDYAIDLDNERATGIMCTDTIGNFQWSKFIRDTSFSFPMWVSKLKSNNFILAVLKPYFNISPNQYEIHFYNILKNGQAVSHYFIPYISPFNYNDAASLCSTNDGGYAFFNILNFPFATSGILKVGPSLIPSCITHSTGPIFQKEIKLKSYNEPNTISSSSPIIISSYTVGLSTISVAATPQCSNNCSTSASFKSSSASFCKNSLVSFTNTSQNFSSCVWKINGNNVSASSNLNYTFNSTGNQKVTLIVNGACIDSSIYQIYIDSIPSIDFNWAKTNLQYTFTPFPLKNNMKLEWTFNGLNKDLINDTTVYSFEDVGTKTVCLKYINSCGSNQTCKTITVTPDVTNKFYKVYKNNPSNGTWQYGKSAIQTPDGGYYLATVEAYNPSPWRSVITRLDSSGTPIWSKKIDWTGPFQEIEHLQLTKDGGALFAGTGTNMVIGKIASNGRVIRKHFNINSFIDKTGKPTELPDGKLVFCGGRYNKGYITLLYPNLNNIFFKEFHAFKNITAFDNALAPYSYALGTTTITNNVSLIKLDSLFNVVWIKSLSFGSGAANALGLIVTKTGKIYITGDHNNSGFVSCLDSSGNNLWTKKYGNNTSLSKSIIITKSGKLFVSGLSTYADLIEIDTSGNLLSSRKFTYSNALYITRTFDDQVLLSGTYNNPNIYNNFGHLLKSNSSGFPPCSNYSIAVNQTAITPTISLITSSVSNANPLQVVSSTTTSISISDSLICINSNNLNPSFQPSVGCAGNITFTNTSTGPIGSYYWTFSGGSPSTSTLQNPSCNWNAPGTYSVNLTLNGVTSFSQNVIVYANPNISVTANTSSICAGDSVVLIAYGATNYTWNTSQITSSIVVNPNMTTIYSVSATNNNNCSDTGSFMITVIQPPNLYAPFYSDTVCLGGTILFNITGATNYTWSNTTYTPWIIVSPSLTTTYTVWGEDYGCTSSATFTANVNPPPNLGIIANPSLICSGQQTTLTANGAITYTWLPGGNTQTLIITPLSNTTFTLFGIDNNGCDSSIVFTLTVSSCTNMKTSPLLNNNLMIYPNPFSKTITIKNHSVDSTVEIYNTIGMLVYSCELIKPSIIIDLSGFPNGLYTIRVNDYSIKIIKDE